MFKIQRIEMNERKMLLLASEAGYNESNGSR